MKWVYVGYIYITRRNLERNGREKVWTVWGR